MLRNFSNFKIALRAGLLLGCSLFYTTVNAQLSVTNAAINNWGAVCPSQTYGVRGVTFNTYDFMPGIGFYDNGNDPHWTAEMMSNVGTGQAITSTEVDCHGNTKSGLIGESISGGTLGNTSGFQEVFGQTNGGVNRSFNTTNNTGMYWYNYACIGQSVSGWLRAVLPLTTTANVPSTGTPLYSKIIMPVDIQYSGSNVHPENAYFKFFRWKFPAGAQGLSNSDNNTARPGVPYKLVRFVDPSNSTQYIVVALVKTDMSDRGYFGFLADGNTSTTNSYQVYYSWSPVKGAYSMRRENAPFTTVGSEMHLHSNLEVRFFTAPLSESGYNSTVNQVMADVHSAYAAANPFQNDFIVKAPIGVTYLTGATAGTSVNPRRWVVAGNGVPIDVTTTSGQQFFRRSALNMVRTSCQNVVNMGGQGLMLWDIEGQESNQTGLYDGASFVGDPRLVASYAPEMDLTITADASEPNLYGSTSPKPLQDEIFKVIKDYGLLPGVTIRPQIAYWPGRNGAPSDGSCPRQIPYDLTTNALRQSNNAQMVTLLADKIYYAYSRFGARLFYIDSPYGYNPSSFKPIPIDAEVFDLVRTEVKNRCLANHIQYKPIMISPEKVMDFDYLRFTTPYWRYSDGGAISVAKSIPSNISATYPTANQFLYTTVTFATSEQNQLTADINATMKNEILACRQITGFQAWSQEGEYGILYNQLYGPSAGLPTNSCLLHYNPDPSSFAWQWVSTQSSTGIDRAYAAVADPGSNLFVVSSISNGTSGATFKEGSSSATVSAAGGTDVALSKYNGSGARVWTTTIGGPNDDNGFSIARTSVGDLIVVGSMRGTTTFNSAAGSSGSSASMSTTGASDEDVFVTKYGATGGFFFAFHFGSNVDDSENESSVAVDANDNFFVGGGFRSSCSFSGLTNAKSVIGGKDGFVAKYDASGLLVWVNFIGSTGGDEVTGLATTPDGSVYAVAKYAGTLELGATLSPTGTYAATVTGIATSGTNTILIKYNSAGVLQWYKAIGGTGSDVFNTVSVDKSGNVVVAGYFDSPSVTLGSTTLTNAGGKDAFAVSYDPSGSQLYARGLAGTGDEEAQGTAVDQFGNIYVSGYYTTTAVASDNSSITLPIASGSKDIFGWRLTAAGASAQAISAGKTLDDQGGGLASMPGGGVVFLGQYGNHADFGTTLTNFNENGSNGGMIARFGPVGGLRIGEEEVSIPEISAQTSLHVFPNPAAGKVTIQVANGAENAPVQVYSTMGALVKTGKLDKEASVDFDLSQLPTGLYRIRCQGKTASFVKQ